jgi:hypothetical protein
LALLVAAVCLLLLTLVPALAKRRAEAFVED